MDYNTIISFLQSFFSDLIAGVLIFFMGLYWKRITFYYKLELRKFQILFGKGTVNDGKLFITSETYYFDRELFNNLVEYYKAGINTDTQYWPFYKMFPESHKTMFSGPDDAILRYCSSRAASYLIEGFRDVRSVYFDLISDSEGKSKWQATFINIGTSVTNAKSDDIKKLPENKWLENDMNGYEFRDGSKEKFDNTNDKGIILKMSNPHSPGHTLFICSGQKEWGTSGAAWYLSKHWKTLSRRFGNNPFLIVLNVSVGSDESACEIRFYGEEKWSWKFYCSITSCCRKKL